MDVRDLIRDRIILDESAIIGDADGYGICADDILRDLRDRGYTIVPIEPTDAMLRAMTMQPPTWDDDASRRKWEAALSAIGSF